MLPSNMEVTKAKVLYDNYAVAIGRKSWCAAYDISISNGTITKSARTKASNILEDEKEQTLHF